MAKPTPSTSRKNEEFGIFKWLMNRHIKNTLISEKKAEEIVLKYQDHYINHEVFNKNQDVLPSLRIQSSPVACQIITQDFESFTSWFKTNKNQL